MARCGRPGGRREETRGWNSGRHQILKALFAMSLTGKECYDPGLPFYSKKNEDNKTPADKADKLLGS